MARLKLSDKSRRILKDLVVFFTLLLLILAQVVVYRYDHDRERHGLDRDHAELVFFNTLDEDQLRVTQVSTNCYKCEPQPVPDDGVLLSGENVTYVADVTYPITIFMKSSDYLSCNVTHFFNEYSVHYFNLSKGVTANCSFVTVDNGEDPYLPVLYAAIIVGVVSAVWILVSLIYRVVTKGKKDLLNIATASPAPDNEATQEDSSNIQHQDPYEGKTENSALLYGSGSIERKQPRKKKNSRDSPSSTLIKSNLITAGTSDDGGSKKTPVAPKSSHKRLLSLDAFRGFSLTIMIFVNYGGGGYYFFSHSRWNGLTIADLVFPWFVWIMGVSLVFSFQGRRKDTFLQQLFQIFRRTVILFAFGLFFISNDASTSLSKMRIPGVLQRLAFTYFVVAFTELCASQLYRKKSFTFWKPMKDISNNWVQWVMVAVLECIWLMITFLLPLGSDCPRGYLGPGGISEGGKYQNCTGGAARVVDYWILGEHHMYSGSTAKALYQLKVRFEPEGILGTLNSIVLCYLGAQAGRTLLHFRGRHSAIISRFIAWGVALCAFATLLCLGQKNDGLIPVNKNLWSLSFILLLAGFGYLILAVFYLIIDVFPIWNGAPFRYPGMNSILVYMGHEILHRYFPLSVYDEQETHFTFLFSNLISVCVWLLVSYYWYSVEFFVKI